MTCNLEPAFRERTLPYATLSATLSGTNFSGAADTDQVFRSDTDATLSNVTVDAGSVYLKHAATISDSTFAGASSVYMESLSGTFVAERSTFTGRGGTAFAFDYGSPLFSAQDLIVTGYDEFTNGCPTILDSTITGVGTLGTFDLDCAVVLDGVALETTGDGLTAKDGTLTITNTDIVAGGGGLHVSAEVALTGVTIASVNSGITVGGGTLTAVGLDIVAGESGIMAYSTTRQTAGLDLDDVTIDALNGSGILGTTKVSTTLQVSNTVIAATETGIAAEGEGTATLNSVTIDASTGIDLYAYYTTATDVWLTATGDGVIEGGMVWSGGSIDAGGTGFWYPWNLTVSGATLRTGADAVLTRSTAAIDDSAVTSVGSCVIAETATSPTTISGLSCTAGDAPLDLVGWTLTLSDVLVQNSTSLSPSSMSSSTGVSLTNVRFLNNTTTSGAGALLIEDSAVTATGLNFQGNTGVDAGALVVTNSTGTVSGSVFRDNVASAGPGAVLDAGGLDWDCSVFEQNHGTAGDIEFDEPGGLDHVTLSSSSATTGALAIDASYITLTNSIITAGTGAGVYGDSSVRTTFFTYNDVWGHSAGDWAGGISDPTGTNGNIISDPQLDASLQPAVGSPVKDAGDPTQPESDGTPSDLGALAEACPELDFDGDGQLSTEGDCDDDQVGTYLGATEVVGSGADEDCDGVELCYVDADLDGYRGDESGTITSTDADCTDSGEADSTAPTGDCDDSSSAYNPGAVDDCTEANDYNCDGSVSYDDADSDGWAACVDCDDTTGGINPAATELPGDGVDSDCDGVDLCYVDADEDGYRPDDSTVAGIGIACDQGGEAIMTDPVGDCDDLDPVRNPAAAESVGTGVDDDCDGDEVCYVDADQDGYRPDETSTVHSSDGDCADAGEALSTALTGDCDDDAFAYNPGASDDCTVANDYNCDGSVGFADVDADGWAACLDCDDTDAGVSPGSTELPGDGIDGDCDGTELCFVDADDDGYRPDDSTITSAGLACDQPGEAVATDPSGDCDDNDSAQHPGATEIPCDDLDNDCAGDGDDTECGGDTGDTDTDTDTDAEIDTDEKRRGCATVPGDSSAALVLLGLAITGRRRRS